MIERGPRLTASPWLRRGCMMVPGLPGARLARTCELVIASPPRGAPSSRRFLPGGRPCPWPLTLSVALPRSGLWDLIPTERGRTRIASARRLVKGGVLPRSRALATNSIHEHSSRSTRTRSRDVRRSGGPLRTARPVACQPSRAPRQPSFDRSGPDRLSPHRTTCHRHDR